MATTTTNFGWDIPQSTDLVKDGATAIAALGQDIDTALIDLKGGTTGQVLAKASGTDLDFSWATPSVGKVAQVLSTLKTDTFSTTSTSAVSITGLSRSITPSLSTSKVLIIVSLAAGVSNTDGDAAFFQLTGGNSTTYVGDTAGSRRGTVHWVRRDGSGGQAIASTNMPVTMVYLDSPATTSAVTYQAQAYIHQGTAYVNRSGVDNNDGSNGRSASTITVMEILA